MTAWGQAAFAPRRVALVGASAEPGKVGHLLLENLSAGDQVEVVPVHPSASEMLGRVAYRSLVDVPVPIDLAVVVTPAAASIRVMEDCAASRIPAVIVLSGGFAEIGDAGAALEAELQRVARSSGVRLIGPNCFGLIDVRHGLNASLAMGMPAQGGVSLFTQSGSYGMAAFSRSKEGAIGFAKVLSAGNKSDINEVDAIRFFGQDQDTRVVALVLESLADGPGLVAALRAVTPHKPVVVLKTGRSSAGQRAASSHTAAMAQDFPVTRAVLRQAGAIVVDDGLMLFDVASALDRQPPRRGRRVAIISNSGGTGVELADLCESQGLEVPELSEALRQSIAQVLPPHGSARNPIDVTTAWQRFGEMYGHSMHAVLASDEIDAVVPVLLQRSALDEAAIDAVIAQTEAARAAGIEKPVHVCWAAPREADGQRRKLQAAGVPCHEWAAQTARVLERSHVSAPEEPPSGGPILGRPSGVDDGGWLPPDQLLSLLASWKLPVVAWRLVGRSHEAVHAATELGYPVVLKAVRPNLVHKSEAGAVRLDLRDAAAVRAACQDFERSLGPGPVMVQRQVARGIELMVGATMDPVFGAVMAFGLGGIWAEEFNDVALRLAPFGVEEARSALNELRGRRILNGVRGGPPVDCEHLSGLISDLSIRIARAPWCTELDLNPIVADGDAFTIVDARMRIQSVERACA